MPENTNATYDILQRSVEHGLLHGYFTGELDEKTGRLYAATFVKISDIDFDDYRWLLHKISNGGFGSTGTDPERSKIYHEDGCYSMKDRDACVKEGIYVSYSVKFYGARVEDKWYILKELTYFGDQISEEEARSVAQYGYGKQPMLESTIYWPIEKHHALFYKNDRLYTADKEFAGLPWLVAQIKKDAKEEICRAFSRYFNLEVFIPFKHKMIAERYEEFSVMHEYRENFLTIFPQTKEYVLIPTLVRNGKNEYRVYYFFWHAERKKMYKWTYFTPALHSNSFYYGSIIVDDLKQISSWNDYDYLDSSCTMDDYNFWNTYVLAEENGRFKYLVEM